ncbi:MAG: WYL domain-containing protein [Ferruginibacter sp.]|nr:WYL domain-containing protein [Ferruginibacter sp.]
MPVNKNALLRYRIIDSCLTNRMRKFPSLEDIIQKIEEQSGAGISVSMLNKDLSQMRTLYGAPIKYDRNHNGYFYEEEGFSIMEFPLTGDEIEALDYSTALLETLKGTRMFRHFENAINKLIEGYRISTVLEKSTSQILQVEKPLSDGGSDWLEPMLEAIVNRAAIHLRYQRFGSLEKEHIVSPYLIKEYRNRWYVIGMVHAYSDVRVFALDRVVDAQPVDEKYIQSDDFDADTYFHYSFGITQVMHMQPESIVLKFSPEQSPYIRTMPLHHSQETLEDTEDGLRIQLTVYPTRELVMTVLSYGKEVEVKGSRLFKKMVEDEINTMQKMYQTIGEQHA